mgnify:CR=1 FL=1
MTGGKSDELKGTLEKVLFHNQDSDFVVAKLKLDGGQSVSVIGNLSGVRAGDGLAVRGQWEKHAKFGQQFRITGFEPILPTTLGGLKSYLGSGLIEGIGPQLAERIVDKLGARALEIIQEDPKRLREVDGVGVHDSSDRALRRGQARGGWQAPRHDA